MQRSQIYLAVAAVVVILAAVLILTSRGPASSAVSNAPPAGATAAGAAAAAPTIASASTGNAAPSASGSVVASAASSAPAPSLSELRKSTVRVTNITSVAFAVSWITANPVVGEVRWGPTSDNVSKSVNDRRGQQVSSTTHFVLVTDLNPTSSYFFDVVNGGTVDNNGGKHYTATTGPELGIPGLPNVLFGKVFKSDGKSPADGALVYVLVTDSGPTGNRSSQIITAVTGKDGSWGLDLGVRNADFAQYFQSSPSTVVQITADYGAEGTSSLTMPMTSHDKAIQITLSAQGS